MATLVRGERLAGAFDEREYRYEPPQTPPPISRSRVRAQGKFLELDSRKFYMRGVTYGPFRPNDSGSEYGTEEEVEKDFAVMAANGVNVVRTYSAVPAWFLDAALRTGIRVLIGVGWEQHVAFLDNWKTRWGIERRVRDTVRGAARHPAVLGFTLGNEIPASIVRWYGARRVERFIESLYRIAKREDPEALVTYVNYPTTEYLNLPFVDFLCFNVYLESRSALTSYVARLHNIAGNRPLVLGEVGLDSRRHGMDEQAIALDWQIRSAFSGGCAGVCVFSWTDEWFRGGYDIHDWGFGLTDRSRSPKRALRAVAGAFAEIPFPPNVEWPRITVVVCSYNGDLHVRRLCETLSSLDYPDYDVVIVNDGSTDDTASILADFDFKVITVENGGLSRSRNLGLQACTGEIVAYLDDDTFPDTQWLKYLAWSFLTTDHAGIGGPNIPPSDEGFIAKCVAHSPGGPNHVLLDDQIAEHIPGCNMAFRKPILEEIGGFDREFCIAGDDVDICWRIQQEGGTLGFSPGAMVWHHRRRNVERYLRQQFNYGRAEAMLAAKWPTKFNTAGHVAWRGRLYGSGRTTPVFSKRVVFQGTWGQAPFQAMYEKPGGFLGILPLMPEWHLLVLFLGALAILGIAWPRLELSLLLLVPALLAPVVQAIRSAVSAPVQNVFPNRLTRWWARVVIGVLHARQPIKRLRGRLAEGLHPWPWFRDDFSLFGFRMDSEWHESWASTETRLRALEAQLQRYGARTKRGGDYDRWDLEVRGGTLGAARVLMAIEEHGMGKQLVRYRLEPRFTIPARAALPMGIALTSMAVVPGDRFVIGFLALLLVIISGRALLECAAAANLIK